MSGACLIYIRSVSDGEFIDFLSLSRAYEIFIEVIVNQIRKFR